MKAPLTIEPAYTVPRITDIENFVAGLLAIRKHGIPQNIWVHPFDHAAVTGAIEAAAQSPTPAPLPDLPVSESGSADQADSDSRSSATHQAMKLRYDQAEADRREALRECMRKHFGSPPVPKEPAPAISQSVPWSCPHCGTPVSGGKAESAAGSFRFSFPPNQPWA